MQLNRFHTFLRAVCVFSLKTMKINLHFVESLPDKKIHYSHKQTSCTIIITHLKNFYWKLPLISSLNLFNDKFPAIRFRI